MCAHTHRVCPLGQAVGKHHHSSQMMESTGQMCKHASQSAHPPSLNTPLMSNEKQNSHPAMEQGFRKQVVVQMHVHTAQ